MKTAVAAIAIPEEQSAQRIQSLLNEKQAAAYLCISPNTLSFWRATRRINIPYIVVTSGAIRYRLSALDKYLEERTVGEDGKTPTGVKRHPGGPGRPPKKTKRRAA
jgi:hypothetical protein